MHKKMCIGGSSPYMWDRLIAAGPFFNTPGMKYAFRDRHISRSDPVKVLIHRLKDLQRPSLFLEFR